MKAFKYICVVALGLLTAQCDDYLTTTSPEIASDEFVTTTPDETFKVFSNCYANFRQTCLYGVYLWNDPCGSDAEYYPELNSLNSINAKLQSDQLSVDCVKSQFNGFYSVIGTLSKMAEIISSKSEYKEAVTANKANDWTQLYGEAMTFRAFCYFQLIKHFGDVPYGYENTVVTDYQLSSRFDIYDKIIESVEAVEPLMYKLGEGGINAERFSRSFADALIGQMALYSGGYQTIRTDMDGLYGNLQFTSKGKEEAGCKYARRNDYLDYYKTAEKYLQMAIDNSGTAKLITTDDRSYANNPFQRHFQYFEDLKVSPESLFEVGSFQGTGTGAINSEYGYGITRPSDGGSSNAAPCKGFAAVRILPTVYYGEFDKDDKRRDVSVTATGSKGDGNEKILSFTPGNKCNGGLSINKWDDNRMNPPYYVKQRSNGVNWQIMRMADVILMLAETKAELGGKDAEALKLVNQIRERAFGDSKHNYSSTGETLKEDILKEREFELLGEGSRRWDLIRSGKFSEKAIEARENMEKMIEGLEDKGYYTFENGNTISNYIYTKYIKLDNPLTFDPVEDDPALYPGWRGQYDYSTIDEIKSKIKGTDHNLAIKGLFNYIEPDSETAKELEKEGYAKTDWANKIVENKEHYTVGDFLTGITDKDTPPRYYWPLPFEIITKSNGKITNGYGLKQE